MSSGDLGMQHTVTAGLLHGHLQWVRHVRRSSASFVGPVSFVTASALDPPRLRDSTRSSCPPRPTSAPKLQLDHSPPAAPLVLQTTAAPDNGASAAAEHLSNTLLSYSHRDWEQAQRLEPLCDTTRRYIQLVYPNPPSPILCDHLSSHTRPETANIVDLAAEGRLLQEDDDTILLVRKIITVASTLDGHYGRRSRPPF